MTGLTTDFTESTDGEKAYLFLVLFHVSAEPYYSTVSVLSEKSVVEKRFPTMPDDTEITEIIIGAA